MTINPFITKLQSLPINDLADESVTETADNYVGLNNEQLYEGKTNDGPDITPGYLDDPFFKTKEAAQAYSDWKDRITPSPKRKKGTPNLFINGFYHSTRKIKVVNGSIQYLSDFPDAPDIEMKFKNLDGLNPSKKPIYLTFLRPVFMRLARTFLKL
jgi:hypothetical protein